MSIVLRSLLGAASLLFMNSGASAQDAKPAAQAAPKPADPFAGIPAAKPADVASMDGIIAALYDVISGDAGVERDWNRFRSLFYPGARMIPTGRNAKTGHVAAFFIPPEGYIKSSGPLLLKEGFHEQELTRHVDSFGNIAQVFSAYEARHKLTDEKPFLRGINSMQLFNDGKRWWILTITWSAETADHPLPEKYSKKPDR
jgi:hypothetical protein